MDHISFVMDNASAVEFIQMLPEDWQKEISPYWNEISPKVDVYVIKSGSKILAGGMVFKSLPPNMAYFAREADLYFKNNYYYLGFIWVEPVFRNQQMGSLWLNGLKKSHPEQSYFLLTEEAPLQKFYERNHFQLKGTVSLPTHEEWIFTYSPASIPSL